jgi:iron complex outermembrane receptor protein
VNAIFVEMRRKAAIAAVCLLTLVAGANCLQAQDATGTIQGTVQDPSGQGLQGATIAAANAVQVVKTAVTASDGSFTISGLPAGTYSVQISATGFATQVRHDVAVTAGATARLPLRLEIASVSQEVTVEAEADTSIAAQLSPVKSVLDAGSARTEITSGYINEFTPSVTDFADIVQAAPGTVSYSENGVGLGQAKIYFRGFVDDDYTMTWDGVPFEDANDPSHHSWAYVPAPAIGYVDFDRSPGTASDFGPSNYGGSIHMFSPRLPDSMSMNASESYGSFNTNQILGEFYSGLFGGAKPKANFWFEGHHMSSDGYQTDNFQQRTAGTAKFTYRFSDKTDLAAISTVVLVDSNTPDSDPARAQIAQFGDNFLLESNQFNSNGSYNALYYRYYTYHVPTDFEIVTLNSDLGHSWHFDLKPYTYSYSNHQHLQKDQSSSTATVNYKSAVNKMNQYNRVGVISNLSAASKFGVFRTGIWFEHTPTNRYQIQSDPRTWVDNPAGVNFHENFTITTVQPYVEYQLVAIPRWTITAGLKDAHYNMWLKQFADDGKKVGNLCSTDSSGNKVCLPFTVHDAGYNNWLPSLEANFRIRNNWSAYGQYGRGSIIPFSSVFDVTGAQVAVTPPPTVASTYQGGTVLKLNRLSMDADVYHIHFVNQYSSYTPQNGPNAGFTYYYATPPSNTNGFEGEGNIAFGAGLSLFLNGTIGSAKYEAAAAQAATATEPAQPASPAAWVALAPYDTESLGLTYQSKGFDFGFFNKRVGSRWEDDGPYHQNVPLESFWMNNLFLNYTVRNGSHFDNSKVKFSVNNLFDNHNITDISAANSTSGSLVQYLPDPGDNIQLLPGRSLMVTFQFGFSPKER